MCTGWADQHSICDYSTLKCVQLLLSAREPLPRIAAHHERLRLARPIVGIGTIENFVSYLLDSLRVLDYVPVVPSSVSRLPTHITAVDLARQTINTLIQAQLPSKPGPYRQTNPRRTRHSCYRREACNSKISRA
jgi:hypothetical protein